MMNDEENVLELYQQEDAQRKDAVAEAVQFHEDAQNGVLEERAKKAQEAGMPFIEAVMESGQEGEQAGQPEQQAEEQPAQLPQMNEEFRKPLYMRHSSVRFPMPMGYYKPLDNGDDLPPAYLDGYGNIWNPFETGHGVRGWMNERTGDKYMKRDTDDVYRAIIKGKMHLQDAESGRFFKVKEDFDPDLVKYTDMENIGEGDEFVNRHGERIILHRGAGRDAAIDLRLLSRLTGAAERGRMAVEAFLGRQSPQKEATDGNA